MKKAYSQSQLDQMLADLRVLDAEVVQLERSMRVPDKAVRSYIQTELVAVLRQQRSLAAKVWRIQGIREKSEPVSATEEADGEYEEYDDA